MVWICLAELEESQSLLVNTSDQSPTAKSTPIVKEYCSQELPTDYWVMQLSGTTLKVFLDNNSKESLTSFTVASLVKTSALQEMEKAWKESKADYFLRSCAWPKKSSPNSYSLKIQKEFWPREESKLLNRLPPSGIAAVGLLKAVKRLDHPNLVKDGFVWPTPVATDYKRRDWPADRKRKSPNINCMLNIKNNTTGLKTNPNFLEWLMSYPFGWTELSHWVIPFVLNKRKKRLKN